MPSIVASAASVSGQHRTELPPISLSPIPRLCLRVSLLLPLFLAAQTAVAGEPQWFEVKTEHFRVITDAGERNGREVATRFEQMRAAYGLIFGSKKVNQNVPLQIIAFRNTREIRQYSPLFRGKVVELAGFCIPASDEDFIAIDMSQPNSWETVMHEYAHVLLDANYLPTAPWFDEGFAEFFSTIKVGKNDVQVGDVLPEARALFQGERLKLQELLEIQHHSETYNQNGQARDMFYVESWLLVHYLFDTNLVAKATQYFVLTNNQGVPVSQAVQTAFGMSIHELSDALFAYLRSNKIRLINYKYKDQIVTDEQATVRPIDPLEVRTQLADLHLHELDHIEQGVKELDAVVTENPSQAEAQRALGYAYLHQRDFPKATEHLQAAAQLGSKDPRVYFYTAELLSEQHSASIGSPQVIKNLQRAIELDPNYAEAYGMLGIALMNTGSYAQAETNLARAMALSPRDENSRLNYAFALLNQQKVAEAGTALSAVVHSTNPNVAAQAAQLLQQVNDYESHKITAASAGPRSVPHPPAASTAFNESVAPVAPASPPPVTYLKGVLVQADCSATPGAVLTVASAGKTWKLKVSDTGKAVVIGADKFSCDWSHVKVALNFTPTSSAEGNVISIEIQ
jgi:cytochrome c-type biogenesis protein CcmH/NrfG